MSQQLQLRKLIVGALFVAVALWAVAPVRAQSVKVLNLQCKELDASAASAAPAAPGAKPKKKKPKKKKGKRPFFVAEIRSDAGESKPKEFKIEQTDLDEPVSIVAERVVNYKDSDDPISLVVLIQGDMQWMGNESYEEVDENKMPGAFSALAGAINALIQDAPRRSQGALIIFGGGKVLPKYPMGPIKDLATGLGTQKEYKGLQGVPLIPGLANAVAVLSKRGGRRVLVIFGDGDTQADDAAKAISTQKDQLRHKSIETYVIHYTTDTDASDTAGRDRLNSLATESRNRFLANQAANFGALAKQIQTRIANRLYVHFPTKGFKLDGKPHDMAITFKDDAPEDKRVNFCLYEDKKPSGGSLWWLWLLLIGFLFLIIVILIVRRKPAEPEYEEEEEEYYEPEVAAAPLAASKTMMLGMGGRDDGTPVVGWIVPLSGNNRYQTFKLLAGATTIGSDTEAAQIIIGDDYISGVHAQVVCGPTGFILLDKGAANGCYVMDKRITEHDLVDNDVFTLGKTDFKFKSIN